MFVLYMFLSGDNRQTPHELLSISLSFALILFFIILLPYIVEKKFQNHWSFCLVLATIGLVYSFVEIICFAVAANIDFRGISRFIGCIVFVFGGLIFLLGTIYTYVYIVKRIQRLMSINSSKIEEEATQFLDAFPYGGITTIYNVYTTLIFWLSSFIGLPMTGYRNNNPALILVYFLIFMILPGIIGWVVARTLPRKYYLGRIEKIIALHNEEIKVKQNGKRN